jgi:MinD-like ATPase involved in chromosome partitioning or flagellar assembly
VQEDDHKPNSGTSVATEQPAPAPPKPEPPQPRPPQPASQVAVRSQRASHPTVPAVVPRAVRRHAQDKALSTVADDPPTPETSEDLTADALLPKHKEPPSGGWRRGVYYLSGGLVDLGESRAEKRRRGLVARVQTPVADGHHRVAVLSLKGGVGKTTTAIGLGSILASLRGDRVIAVDANPDRGTLGDKVRGETNATVRDLILNVREMRRYSDVREFTSQAPYRLEVLASERDPAASEAFSAADYRQVAQVVEHFYSVCITDCGAGLLHSTMAGVLGLAHQIVLVSSPSLDGARSASATLDWLDAHHYSELVQSAVVVISAVPAKGLHVDLERLEQHFRGRCRELIRVPYDPHLAEGGIIDVDRLLPETQEAYLALAAAVGDGFTIKR